MSTLAHSINHILFSISSFSHFAQHSPRRIYGRRGQASTASKLGTHSAPNHTILGQTGYPTEPQEVRNRIVVITTSPAGFLFFGDSCKTTMSPFGPPIHVQPRTSIRLSLFRIKSAADSSPQSPTAIIVPHPTMQHPRLTFLVTPIRMHGLATGPNTQSGRRIARFCFWSSWSPADVP